MGRANRRDRRLEAGGVLYKRRDQVLQELRGGVPIGRSYTVVARAG